MKKLFYLLDIIIGVPLIIILNKYGFFAIDSDSLIDYLIFYSVVFLLVCAMVAIRRKITTRENINKFVWFYFFSVIAFMLFVVLFTISIVNNSKEDRMTYFSFFNSIVPILIDFPLLLKESRLYDSENK